MKIFFFTDESVTRQITDSISENLTDSDLKSIENRSQLNPETWTRTWWLLWLWYVILNILLYIYPPYLTCHFEFWNFDTGFVISDSDNPYKLIFIENWLIFESDMNFSWKYAIFKHSFININKFINNIWEIYIFFAYKYLRKVKHEKTVIKSSVN